MLTKNLVYFLSDLSSVDLMDPFVDCKAFVMSVSGSLDWNDLVPLTSVGMPFTVAGIT